MNTVKIRNVILGAGTPKICVPIVGVTKEEILEQAKAMENIPADIVEWRADWFDKVFELEEVVNVLKELRKILKDKPVLFTFRTEREGGEKAIDAETYVELNKLAAATGDVELVDVELFVGDEFVTDIIEFVHGYRVKVIASNHDFEKTPDQEEIIARLCRMQEIGADIIKIAVMPRTKKDVLTLLQATEEMYRTYADRPLVTMSMAGAGFISRICGEIFGSALTFGAAEKASAPGQAEAKELEQVLAFIHKNL